MNQIDILNKFTHQMRKEITFPDMIREVSPNIVRFLRPAPGMSLVLYSNLDVSNADFEIQCQIDFFKDNNLPFSWKLYGYDQPDDLLERLIAKGFMPDPPDALMILDLSAVPDSLQYLPFDNVHRSSVDDLGDIVKILEQVWGGNFDWIYSRLGEHLAVPGYLSIFTGYIDEQPGSVGWTYYPPTSEFASLWGGSTIPPLRGKGLYSSILAARIKEAKARGVHYLVTDASDQSRPILQRFGFFQLTTINNCEFPFTT